MSTVITITESASMPGRFKVTHQKTGKRSYEREGIQDAGSAGAYAMSIAITCKDEYLILGPTKVMAEIPVHLRAGNRNEA